MSRARAEAQERELRRRAVQQAAVTNLGHFALSCSSLDLLQRRAASLVAGKIDADLVLIAQRSDEEMHVVAQAGRELLPASTFDLQQATLIAYTLKTAAPVVVTDRGDESRFLPEPLTENFLSAASVPVIARSHGVWGVLAVYNRTRRVFTIEEIDFLRGIAAVIGQAVARDLLHASLQEGAARQSAIAELSRLMLRSVDQPALERACEHVRTRIDVDFAMFLELDAAQSELRLRAGKSWAPEIMKRVFLGTTQQTAESIARNEPVIVTDYASETRFATSIRFITDGIRSGVVVPVATQNGCAGILTAYARRSRAYHADDIAFIQTVANIVADALDRDRTRRDLAASEERYRDVVEGATEVIFTIDPDGVLLSLNKAFEWATGFLIADWIGRSVLDLVQPRDREKVEAQLRAMHDQLEPVATEISIETARGTILLGVSMLAKRRDERVVAIHGFARDITESRRMERDQRKLEDKLEQANRIASLGRLAATVAHEFNNVLMGVAPFVEVMRRGKNIESSLDHISRAVARGRRITQDILRFTQPAEPARTPIDVDVWMQTITVDGRSLLAPSSVLEVRTHVDRLFVDGDPSQLQQVFTNLILNARDAMPGGGRVTIELGREDEGALLPFALEKPENYVHFVVRDTGSGMTSEMLRHVFEPLFTTKRNGTGLGLPVALQVVQRHGGEIFVESTPGVGTAFHIFLPLSAPAAVTKTPEPVPAPVAARSNAKRVLLVEDDTTVALGIVLLLELEGMDVRVARTGEEALAQMARELPEVVILDFGLPDMDGMQVYESFAARMPSLPVIFSTGHADRTKIEALLSRPNVGFLLKPYNHASLLEVMAEVTKKMKAA